MKGLVSITLTSDLILKKMKTIRVILVDDHPLFRQALKLCFRRQQDIQVIAEASNGEEAVNLTRQLKPDVVIMDIAMPKLNGFEATREISRESPDTLILVLTIHTDNETAIRIFRAGAKGYLIKNASGKQVVQAVRSLFNGETICSLPIGNIIKDASSRFSPLLINNNAKQISPREFEILKLLAKGETNKNIACILDLQESSIKSYIINLFLKLEVGSRTEAVTVGLKSGILSLEDL